MRRGARTGWIALFAAAMALAAAGCGGDDDSSGGAAADSGGQAASESPALVEEARAAAEAASKWPTEWQGPTEPTKAQANKKIVAISCSQATACAQEVEGIADGGKAIGWDVQVVDGKGDPAVYSSAIRNAVTSGADGIVLASINVGVVADALRFAKDHDVPVINNASITADQAGIDPSLVAADNPDPNAERGTNMANWMISDSEGKANVVLFRTQDAGLNERDDAIVARLKECPGCKILEEINAGFDVTTTPKMTQQINSLLDKYGNDLQYIVTPYSAADTFAVPALQSRGRDDVKILNSSPTEQQVKLCSEGKYIGAAYGDDLVWVGWEAIDALNRVFEKPDADLPDQNTVWVMLTKETCPASGNFSEDNPVDFKAKFRELWGVG
jgi:ribose transport system substrate-binding protein